MSRISIIGIINQITKKTFMDLHSIYYLVCMLQWSVAITSLYARK